MKSYDGLLAPCIPAQAGTQQAQQKAADSQALSWIPACAGMSGTGLHSTRWRCVSRVLKTSALVACVLVLAAWDWPWAYKRPDVQILGKWSDGYHDRWQFFPNGRLVTGGANGSIECKYEFVDQATIVVEQCRGIGASKVNELLEVTIDDGRLTMEDQGRHISVFEKR